MELIHKIAIFSLALSGLCALIIIIDILAGHKQKMMVMNFVYPISAIYAGPLALVFYYKIGRKSVEKKSKAGDKMDGEMHQNKKPFWQSVAVGALHCGSGCTLGDIVAETLLLFVPVVIFGSSLAGTWIIDYLFAFVIGIIFQYFSIKPMKKLSTGNAF